MFIIKVSLYNFGSIYSSIKSIQYSLFPKSSFQKCIVFYLEIAQSNQEEESGPVFRLSEEERFPEDKPEEEVVQDQAAQEQEESVTHENSSAHINSLTGSDSGDVQQQQQKASSSGYRGHYHRPSTRGRARRFQRPSNRIQPPFNPTRTLNSDLFVIQNPDQITGNGTNIFARTDPLPGGFSSEKFLFKSITEYVLMA